MSSAERSPIPYDIARNVVAIVLLLAAAFKAKTMAPSSYDFSNSLNWLEILIEWVIAAWLLIAVAGHWLRLATLALLSVFVAVAAVRLLSGKQDCGCFGDVRIYPGYTLAVDLTCLIAIGWLGRGPIAITKCRLDRIAAGALLSISIPAAILLPHTTQRIIVIDPRILPGKTFPLLVFINGPARDELSRGEQIVVLFDHDCEECRKYLAAIGPVEAEHIHILDISSIGNSPLLDQRFHQVFLRSGVECICKVPVRIHLFNGVVESYKLDDR